MVHLPTVWFIIVVVFWVGFFVLEGFDFGVGMLHAFVGRNDVERRLAVNSIGPFWDGNEVWLVVAGAAIFAAFPSWYATMFSTFYLPLTLALLALILRGVSFEFTRKIDSPQWQSFWRWSLTVGSAVIPFLLGTALGDLLHGLPIDSSHNYTGSFWGLLQPFGLYTGATLTALCLSLGSAYLSLKTVGPLHDRAVRLSGPLGWLAAAVTFGWLTWLHVGLGVGFVPNPIEALALAAVVAGAWLADSRTQGWAFTSTAVAIGTVVASIFLELYPHVMVSSTNASYTLTVSNSASPSYTLRVMTVIAALSVPFVLLYQGWSFYIFRKRLVAPPSGTAEEEVTSAGNPTMP